MDGLLWTVGRGGALGGRLPGGLGGDQGPREGGAGVPVRAEDLRVREGVRAGVYLIRARVAQADAVDLAGRGDGPAVAPGAGGRVTGDVGPGALGVCHGNYATVSTVDRSSRPNG